jgi:hypothetical protein
MASKESDVLQIGDPKREWLMLRHRSREKPSIQQLGAHPQPDQLNLKAFVGIVFQR